MNDNVVEEIRLHQETVVSDSNSPLQLIREKELEISGLVLSAKRNADDIIASARKNAAEIVSTAEAEGGAGAADSEKAILDEAKREAETLCSAAHAEAGKLREQAAARREQATRLVLDAVAEL